MKTILCINGLELDSVLLLQDGNEVIICCQDRIVLCNIKSRKDYILYLEEIKVVLDLTKVF